MTKITAATSRQWERDWCCSGPRQNPYKHRNDRWCRSSRRSPSRHESVRAPNRHRFNT